jgi:phosphoribosylanthranilate isomerase
LASGFGVSVGVEVFVGTEVAVTFGVDVKSGVKLYEGAHDPKSRDNMIKKIKADFVMMFIILPSR